MMLETRQLQYFATVAEERHFGKAAERLKLAQPYLSQQIRKLERQLGTTLLNRTTRTVALTSAGSHLLEQARRVLSELDTLGTEVQLIGAGLKGPLRLGFTGSTTYGVMPQVVRRTAMAAPNLQLGVSGEMTTPRLVSQLLERSIDIALLRYSSPMKGLSYQVLGHETCILAVPTGSPLDDLESITAAELAETSLVGYPENSVVSAVTTAFLSEQSASPDYSIRASETSTLMSLVAAGLGPAIVPRTATALEIPGVHFREITEAPRTELALAWRTNEETQTVTRMTRIIAEVVSDVIEEKAADPAESPAEPAESPAEPKENAS
ncbi:LysR family transcriptional regulator [Brevibacterium sp. UCMA 11752]|uniref:LysR family transcriptional regulator n=1 Tax=Brevibacterium sp. UCMA 11752 TaxID=2745946 RepID=UPI001F305BE3|nr:LysR family transcriptional regulator [Brevibacterium sp. UCMA 11752]MCF2586009.1 LysR family transcriptional regulator [Brevibacterium sp. UCMA 11752]